MKKCSNAEFVVKIDDDIFLNIPTLLNYIEDHQNDTRKMYGHVFLKPPPYRDPTSKFYTSMSAYSGKYFPSYLNGPFYMLKNDLIADLYYTALTTPFFKFEDIFMSGFVSVQLGADQVQMEGIFLNYGKYEEIKDIDYLISYQMNKRVEKIFEIWSYQYKFY